MSGEKDFESSEENEREHGGCEDPVGEDAAEAHRSTTTPAASRHHRH